jgi:3',5'-cyclic AMP phosphodiesterase CpdA
LAVWAPAFAESQSFDLVAELARLRQTVEQVNRLKPGLVIICGDLVNEPTPKSFADFNAARAGFKVPCYCVPGNHDVGDVPTAQSLARYRQAIGKDYYSFEHGGFTFIVVNTQLWKTSVPGESEKHDTWFKATLAAAAQKKSPVVVAGHIPLFGRAPDEPNGHDNLPRAKRRELLSLFEQYGVQLMLAGHTHRTLILQYKQTQMVTSATTSMNVDFRPFGFRLWHLTPDPPFRHEFVATRNGLQHQGADARPVVQGRY